jgi:predicted DNA-binding protein YlxM (UPF0122 family)
MELYQEEALPDLYKNDDILQNQAIILRERLNYLHGRDKIIMSMYLINGISYRQIALLLKINQGTIFRIIKKTIHKLTEGVFAACIEKKEKFSSNEISIAKDYFVNDLSIRQIANKYNTSFYNIREQLNEIKNTAENYLERNQDDRIYA